MEILVLSCVGQKNGKHTRTHPRHVHNQFYLIMSKRQSIMIYIFDINKKPASPQALLAYIKNILVNTEEVSVQGGTIQVRFPSSITSSDKAVLDALIKSYPDYEEISSGLSHPEIKVIEERIKTQGNFRIEGLSVSSPPSSTQEQTFSWKYPINILGIKINSTTSTVNNVINGSICPTTPIGTTLEDSAQGFSQLTLSSSALQYINIGYTLRTSQSLGDVISISPSTNTVILDTPLSTSIPANSPIFIERIVVKNMKLTENLQITIGDLSIGATYVPANTLLCVKYTNVHNTPSDFTFFIEYFY